MGFLNKMHGIQGLFLALVLILAISPKTIKDVYDTILGRIIFIAIIVFFTQHNVTLGLLVVLILIISSHIFLVEGLENIDTANYNAKENTKYYDIVSKIKTIVNADDDESGIDKQTIHESVSSKSSKTLPIPTSDSTEDVEPTTDSFANMKMSPAAF
jgi:hypothetical protein